MKGHVTLSFNATCFDSIYTYLAMDKIVTTLSMIKNMLKNFNMV